MHYSILASSRALRALERSWRVCILFAFFVVLPVAGFAGERYPVVFAHGFGVPAALYEDVVPLRQFFEKKGFVLHIARTPVAGPLEERSRILYQKINQLVPQNKF